MYNLKQTPFIVLMLSFFFFVCCTYEEDRIYDSNSENLSKSNHLDLFSLNESNIDFLMNDSNLKYSDSLYDYNIISKVITIDKLRDSLYVDNNIIDVSGIIFFANNNEIVNVGIEYYEKDTKQGYISFYSYNDNINKLYTYSSNGVNLTNLMRLNYITNNANNIILISDDESDNLINTNYKEEFSLFVTSEFYENRNSKSNDVPVIIEEPGSSCGYVNSCTSGSGICKPLLFYCEDQGGEPGDGEPDDGDCPRKSTISILSENSYTTESGVLDTNLHYEFRDNFLNNSILGKKYIELFYLSNRHFEEALDIELAIEIYNLSPKINLFIENLFDTNFEGILINNEFKTELISLINEIENKSSSQVFKNILDNLSDDITQLSNKTKNNFIEEFQIMR